MVEEIGYAVNDIVNCLILLSIKYKNDISTYSIIQRLSTIIDTIRLSEYISKPIIDEYFTVVQDLFYLYNNSKFARDYAILLNYLIDYNKFMISCWKNNNYPCKNILFSKTIIKKMIIHDVESVNTLPNEDIKIIKEHEKIINEHKTMEDKLQKIESDITLLKNLDLQTKYNQIISDKNRLIEAETKAFEQFNKLNTDTQNIQDKINNVKDDLSILDNLKETITDINVLKTDLLQFNSIKSQAENILNRLNTVNEEIVSKMITFNTNINNNEQENTDIKNRIKIIIDNLNDIEQTNILQRIQQINATLDSINTNELITKRDDINQTLAAIINELQILNDQTNDTSLPKLRQLLDDAFKELNLSNTDQQTLKDKIQENINILENTIKTATSDFDEKDKIINTISKQVDDLSNTISDKNKLLTTLTAQIDNIRETDIQKLQQDISNIQNNDLTTITEQINYLNKILTSMTNELDKLNDGYNDKSIPKLKQLLDNAFDQFNELDTELLNSNIMEKMNSISKDLNQLSIFIETKTNEIDTTIEEEKKRITLNMSDNIKQLQTNISNIQNNDLTAITEQINNIKTKLQIIDYDDTYSDDMSISYLKAKLNTIDSSLNDLVTKIQDKSKIVNELTNLSSSEIQNKIDEINNSLDAKIQEFQKLLNESNIQTNVTSNYDEINKRVSDLHNLYNELNDIYSVIDGRIDELQIKNNNKFDQFEKDINSIKDQYIYIISEDFTNKISNDIINKLLNSENSNFINISDEVIKRLQEQIEVIKNNTLQETKELLNIFLQNTNIYTDKVLNDIKFIEDKKQQLENINIEEFIQNLKEMYATQIQNVIIPSIIENNTFKDLVSNNVLNLVNQFDDYLNNDTFRDYVKQVIDKHIVNIDYLTVIKDNADILKKQIDQYKLDLLAIDKQKNELANDIYSLNSQFKQDATNYKKLLNELLLESDKVIEQMNNNIIEFNTIKEEYNDIYIKNNDIKIETASIIQDFQEQLNLLTQKLSDNNARLANIETQGSGIILDEIKSSYIPISSIDNLIKFLDIPNDVRRKLLNESVDNKLIGIFDSIQNNVDKLTEDIIYIENNLDNNNRSDEIIESILPTILNNIEIINAFLRQQFTEGNVLSYIRESANTLRGFAELLSSVILALRRDYPQLKETPYIGNISPSISNESLKNSLQNIQKQELLISKAKNDLNKEKINTILLKSIIDNSTNKNIKVSDIQSDVKKATDKQMTSLNTNNHVFNIDEVKKAIDDALNYIEIDKNVHFNTIDKDKIISQTINTLNNTPLIDVSAGSNSNYNSLNSILYNNFLQKYHNVYNENTLYYLTLAYQKIFNKYDGNTKLQRKCMTYMLIQTSYEQYNYYCCLLSKLRKVNKDKKNFTLNFVRRYAKRYILIHIYHMLNNILNLNELREVYLYRLMKNEFKLKVIKTYICMCCNYKIRSKFILSLGIMVINDSNNVDFCYLDKNSRITYLSYLLSKLK